MADYPVFSRFADQMLKQWINAQQQPFSIIAPAAVLGCEYTDADTLRRIEAFLLENGCLAIDYCPPYHKRPSRHYVGPGALPEVLQAIFGTLPKIDTPPKPGLLCRLARLIRGN